jgi:hypothetical protein
VIPTLATLTIMNKTTLHKQIASLTAERDNAQFRAGVIERRLEQLDREADRLRHDRRPRSNLLLGNNRRAADNLRVQLRETYEVLTLAALELELIRVQLPNVPPEPVKSVRRDTERHGAGLYRMGRVAHGRSIA